MLLHQRLHFDTAHGQVLDDARRYVLLRADVLMATFDALPAPQREAALRAFGAAVFTHGSDSLRAYAAQPGGQGDALLTTVQDAAASLGWGRWRLIRDDASLSLQVDNSPFAAAARHGAPACHAIAGMLQGLATALWGEGATAAESACAAQHAGTRCQFIARPAAAPTPLSPSGIAADSDPQKETKT
jgi:hypothetical protein